MPTAARPRGLTISSTAAIRRRKSRRGSTTSCSSAPSRPRRELIEDPSNAVDALSTVRAARRSRRRRRLPDRGRGPPPGREVAGARTRGEAAVSGATRPDPVPATPKHDGGAPRPRRRRRRGQGRLDRQPTPVALPRAARPLGELPVLERLRHRARVGPCEDSSRISRTRGSLRVRRLRRLPALRAPDGRAGLYRRPRRTLVRRAPPHCHGTVEVRAPDAQRDPPGSLAFVEYVHALVVDYAERYADGESPPTLRRELLDENKWRAIRHGHDASFITRDGEDTVSLGEAVADESATASESTGSETCTTPRAGASASADSARRAVSTRSVTTSCCRRRRRTRPPVPSEPKRRETLLGARTAVSGMTTDDSDDDSGDDPAFDAADGPASTADDESPTDGANPRGAAEDQRTARRERGQGRQGVRRQHRRSPVVAARHRDPRADLRLPPRQPEQHQRRGRRRHRALPEHGPRGACGAPRRGYRRPRQARGERRGQQPLRIRGDRAERAGAGCRRRRSAGAQRRVQPRPAARRRVPDGDTEPVQISVDSDDEDEKRSDEADEADDGEEDGTKSDR